MPSVVKFEKRQPQFIREASILTILVGRGGKNRTPMDTFCASFQQFREPKTLQDMDTCLDTLCLEGEGCRQFSATLEDTGGVVLLKGITNVQDTRWLRSCRQELAVVCGLSRIVGKRLDIVANLSVCKYALTVDESRVANEVNAFSGEC